MKKKFKRILLVDDDDTSNLLTTMIINDMDITEEVDVALNGEEALKYIVNKCEQARDGDQANCPGLILLDINMPIMDGFEFLEAYTNKFEGNSNIPIVMLSSSANRKDFDKAKAFNIAGYIVKPLNEEKLQMALANS